MSTLSLPHHKHIQRLDGRGAQALEATSLSLAQMLPAASQALIKHQELDVVRSNDGNLGPEIRNKYGQPGRRTEGKQ